MEKIILVTGENGRAVENYPAKRLARGESYPAQPYWLDLLSPSENNMWLISKGLKLDRRVVRACLSHYRVPSCEEFDDYLFIQTSLLEPSKTKLFFQRDIKIILGREYLITVHKSRTSLHCLLSNSTVSGFSRTGTLLLTLLDSSIEKVVESFCYADQTRLLLPTNQPPHKSPLWWQLRNFRAALFRDANFLQGIAITGDRFFGRDDKRLFDSIGAQNQLLSSATTRLLSRMYPPVEVPYAQMQKKIS